MLMFFLVQTKGFLTISVPALKVPFYCDHVLTFGTEAGDITEMDFRPLFKPFCTAEESEFSVFALLLLFSLSLAATAMAMVLFLNY